MNFHYSVKIISLLLILASCEKPVESEPQMNYLDLGNKEVKFNESALVDLNNDGINDISFHTLFDGDPIAKHDKHKYLVSSKKNCMLPLNAEEKAPMLSKTEFISLENFGGYQWLGIAQTELVQKVIQEAGDPYCEGVWKEASHKYLPVKLLVNNQRFAAWIELSFDASAEKIILHRAAISKYPERDAIAGI